MATFAQVDQMQECVLFGLPMPMTLRFPKALSDEELIAFSRRNRPFRIEENAQGELEIMSPVGFDGGQREIFVGARLFDWAEQNGGIALSSNAGFRMPDGSVRSPDAAWISDLQWQALSRDERRKFPPICPEFLIEILSESDSRSVLEAKMQMWLNNGAKLAWMIDPYARRLSIYRPGAEVEVLDRPESVEAGEPVVGFRLSTLLLWDD